MSQESYAAVFVSDVHLGMRLAREAAFADWLERIDTQQLYLNGDLFDGWRLRRRFGWTADRTRIVDRLLAMAAAGTRITLVTGNHDDFLRGRFPRIVDWPVVDECVHECACGRRLLVTHGDLFDPVERRQGRLSRLGSILFDTVSVLLPVSACHWIKRTSKRVFGRPDRLAGRLIGVARERGLDGVVFGHIHQPVLRKEADGLVVANSGDWVQHASWLAELPGGGLRLTDEGRVVAEIPPG